VWDHHRADGRCGVTGGRSPGAAHAAGAVAAGFGISGARSGYAGENSLAAGGHNAVTREDPGADGGGDARRWLGTSSPLPTLGQLAGGCGRLMAEKNNFKFLNLATIPQ
jgi:hypothetical protein